MCQAPVPLIDTLQSLRRGVALDLLSPTEAKSQVQIAVVGLRKEVVFQQALADLIAAYQPVLTGIDESIASARAREGERRGPHGRTADELEQKRRATSTSSTRRPIASASLSACADGPRRAAPAGPFPLRRDRR